MKNIRIEVGDKVIQFVKFSIVGLSNTVFGYIIYVLCLKCIRRVQIFPTIDIYISQFVMFILSVLWSFYWNNRMVFTKQVDEERNIIHALVKTYITYTFTNLFLAEVMLHLWVNILEINEYIAPIINLLITVPLNFVIQKYWAFRGK